MRQINFGRGKKSVAKRVPETMMNDPDGARMADAEVFDVGGARVNELGRRAEPAGEFVGPRCNSCPRACLVHSGGFQRGATAIDQMPSSGRRVRCAFSLSVLVSQRDQYSL